jgi:hypothetical protein
LRLRLPPVFNIYVGPTPFDDIAVFVAQWVGAEHEPAVHAIETSKPGLDLARFASFDERPPNL